MMKRRRENRLPVKLKATYGQIPPKSKGTQKEAMMPLGARHRRPTIPFRTSFYTHGKLVTIERLLVCENKVRP